MHIYLIRHGQSEADLTGVHEGRADFPLTSLGQQQAGLLAKKMNEYDPQVILSSSLKRAHRTAEILQKRLECPLEIHDTLMEFNNGVLAGMDRKEALERYPMPEGGRPYHVPIEGGESELEFRFRAEEWVHRLRAEYGNYSRVVIVSHGGWISQLLKAFLDLPVTNTSVFATGDTGVHGLEWRENQKIIRFLNNQDHLQ